MIWYENKNAMHDEIYGRFEGQVSGGVEKYPKSKSKSKPLWVAIISLATTNRAINLSSFYLEATYCLTSLSIALSISVLSRANKNSFPT